MKRGEGDSTLDWLQEWYERHCNGDWEHQYGVSIDTIDNPGWMVKIDLTGTALEVRTLERVRLEESETDWLHYWVEEDRFEAAGGPTNLTTMLLAFRNWVEGQR
jgi:hypothetical protein